jgi:hypothetical protein
MLATCFETQEDGNCHLLCRTCHSADHNGTLAPSYTDRFINKNGSESYFELVRRGNKPVLFAKQFIFDEEMRLRHELECILKG